MDDLGSQLKGYSQVTEFEPDVNEEYEEEDVFYVTMDFGEMDPKILPSVTSLNLMGLDSPTPFVQLAGNTFKGSHETLLGTEIILQDPEDTAGPSRIVAPLTTTSTRIRFREVELKKKEYPTIFGHSEFVGGDEPLLTRPTTTLGGVVRDDQPSFFPNSIRVKQGANPLFRSGKNKRRWKKRPEGFATDEEEDGEGENSLNSKGPGKGRAEIPTLEDAGLSGEPREYDTDMYAAGEDEGREVREDPGPSDVIMENLSPSEFRVL